MFEQIFSQKKKILIPYVTAGVPSLLDSESIINALIEEGAEIIELGVPFSDPSADGVILQSASDLALENGVTLLKVLELAKKINTRHPLTPIVLFTYLNPLLAMGLEKYVHLAKESGIAATLTVDLPVEEAADYIRLHRSVQLETVFLASPTTGAERLKSIAEASTAFVYYVSRTGVTGERVELSETLGQEVEKIRETIKRPLAIGFGISNPDQAKAVSLFGDAVVIGSAYMRMILDHHQKEEREMLLRKFTRSCISAIRE